MESKDFSKLDLAFVLDTTSSMGSYIENAKNNIKSIAEEIIKSEKCHLRIGLVRYRDHPPQDSTYITQVEDLTDDMAKAKDSITNTKAYGGGDLPESICCGLYDCLNKLSWRDDSIKCAILIADAPPHGLQQMGDSFPNGCPLHNDPVDIAHKMAEKGITLYCAGCEPALLPYRQFFIALTLITGGKYVPLNDASELARVIIGGTKEEISMEKMMAQVHNEVMKEAAEKGTRVDEDELTRRIHNLINSKKDGAIEINRIENKIEVNDEVKEFSKIKTLKELVEKAKTSKTSLSRFSLFSSSPIIPSVCVKKTVKTPLKRLNKAKVVRIAKPKRIFGAKAKKTIKISVSISSNSSRFLGSEFKKGLRRSFRLLARNKTQNKSRAASKKNSQKVIKRLVKTSNVKLDAKAPFINNKMNDYGLDMNEARRLVKKAIARNKLSS